MRTVIIKEYERIRFGKREKVREHLRCPPGRCTC